MKASFFKGFLALLGWVERCLAPTWPGAYWNFQPQLKQLPVECKGVIKCLRKGFSKASKLSGEPANVARHEMPRRGERGTKRDLGA